MSNDVNTVTIIGNLTKDVEVKYSQDGKAIAKIGIAVNDDYKETKKVYFFGVTMFGASAENCGKYLSKGKKIAVTGKLVQDRWEKDGKKNSMVNINANKVQFLSPVESSNQQGNQQQTQQGNNDFYDSSGLEF